MYVHILALEVTEIGLMEIGLPHTDPRCRHLRAKKDTFSLQHCFLTQAYLGCNTTSRASAVSGLPL